MRDDIAVSISSAPAAAYDGAVTSADLDEWERELVGVVKRIQPLFHRTESKQHAEQYLRGLLSPLARKNGWTISEYVGASEPKALQRFLNLTPWDADALLAINREYAMEHLADPDGILVADPTGFAKKGRKSVGVQRQYSGTAGRIENCQLGVFLTYASQAGHTLLDRELYLPKIWTQDAARCREAHVPAEVSFATKPELAARMLAEIPLTRGGSIGFQIGDQRRAEFLANCLAPFGARPHWQRLPRRQRWPGCRGSRRSPDRAGLGRPARDIHHRRRL